MLRSPTAAPDTPAGPNPACRPADQPQVAIPLLAKAVAAGVSYEALTRSLTRRAHVHFGPLPAWWTLVALLPEPETGPWPILALRIDKLLAQQVRPIVKAHLQLHAAGVDDPDLLDLFTSTQMLAGTIAREPIVRVETLGCGTNLIRDRATSVFIGHRYDPSLLAEERLGVITADIAEVAIPPGVRIQVSARPISGPLLEPTPWLRVAGHRSGRDMVEAIVRGRQLSNCRHHPYVPSQALGNQRF